LLSGESAMVRPAGAARGGGPPRGGGGGERGGGGGGGGGGGLDGRPPPNFFWANVAGLLSVFPIGLNVEPTWYSFLDNVVEGVGYFHYFIIYGYFVAGV